MKTHRFFWMILAAAGVLAAVGIVRHDFAGRTVANSAPGRTSNNRANNATAALIVNNDLRSAVLAAFRESNPLRRAQMFGLGFADWFRHDPEAALVWLRQLPPGAEYNQGLFIALQAIGGTDPQRALALAADMAVTHEQKAVYNVLFAEFARADLPSAVGLLEMAPAGEARDNALRAVTDAWVARDIPGALDWAGNLDDPGERDAAMESVLTALAATDPQRALDLASQNLAGSALDRIQEKSLNQLASTDPAAAAAAVSQLPEGGVQRNTAVNVARALTAQDPAVALAWLASLPAATQPVVLNNVLEVWMKADPTAAAQYVAELPAGPAQDSIVSRFAENWATKDVFAAVTWAQTLTSLSAQNAAVISIASGWARMDPAAATQWAAGLPANYAPRTEALRGAYSYWQLADAAMAGNFLNSLPVADRIAIQSAALAQQ